VGKNTLSQELRGAIRIRLPLLPSGPGGVGRHLSARFLTQSDLMVLFKSEPVKI